MTHEEAISKLNELIECTIDREKIDDTCYAIIEYLEAQTPHVMTLEEVHNWINADTMQRDPIFEETRGHDYGEWIDPFDDYDTADIVGYGESVRCWNTRPTDEHRKAAAWHEA